MKEDVDKTNTGKFIKRHRALMLVAAVLVLTLAIQGCSRSTSKEGEEFFGRWSLVRIETPDMDLGREELAALMEEDEEYFVEINKDGTMKLKAPIAGDELREMSWELMDDTLIGKDENDSDEFTIQDDLLVETFEDIKIYYEKEE